MKMGTRTLATGLAALATLVGGATAVAAETPANSITVNGTGHTMVKATSASFSAGVTVNASTARVALTRASKRMHELRAALHKAGVAAADLTTNSISTYRKDRTHAVAEQTIDVKVEQVANTGRLLAIANRAGASNVYGPQFTYGSTDAAYQQALLAALANARAKATVIATAIKSTLGDTISVSEGSTAVEAYQASGMAAAPARGPALVPVPIKAPPSTVEADVVVVYSFH